MAPPAQDLSKIQTFPQLVRYLRDELDWPIETESFEDLTFDYSAEELGIDSASAAKIEEIKRLRPLSVNQPWGVFFVKFEPKRLPVVALRRILSSVVLKKRASANHAERAAWDTEDLLFISNYGTGEERQISFAHFATDPGRELPTLKVLGWDNLDTPLHIEHVVDTLRSKLTWPQDERNVDAWRATWRSAFTLRYREVITTSRTLAIRLAELARAIRSRIHTVLEIESPEGPVTQLLRAFREAVVHDLDGDGFADMYAQTVAYGLLTARVTNPRAGDSDGLAGRLPITTPFLRDLLETFLSTASRGATSSNPSIDFDELGVTEVTELLDDTNMAAVVRDFGDRNPQEDPVIHFYELFLKEYDAKKRMQRGVFYTPRPVVSFIVRSVHELLRAEFGLEDGLADTATWRDVAAKNVGLVLPPEVSPDDCFVAILDPATGTGTFLVESIDMIHRTLLERWNREGHDAAAIADLWNAYVPKHLLPRLHGYELLMAPYAIAHLKIGLKLHETGYRFGNAERVRIYLTNALEPASDKQLTLDLLPALAHEAQAVNEVKRRQHFTVVIGNPPYSNYGQLNKNPFILGLLDDYKRGLAERKLNLDDDFIKFIRFAQWVIQRSGAGVLSLITNNTYIDGLAHRVMRRTLIGTFAKIWIEDLHGSSKRNETSLQDENVFDIQQGVAIGTFVRPPQPTPASNVRFGELWGTRATKYSRLAAGSAGSAGAVALEPHAERYLFVPKRDGLDEYGTYRAVSEIFPVFSSGIDTKVDRLLIDRDPAVLAERVEDILDPTHSIAEIRARYEIPPTSTWEIARAKTAIYSVDRVRPITYRVFDDHFTYFDGKVLSRAREAVMEHMIGGDNLGLISARQLSQRGREWALVGISDRIIERCAISSNTREGNYLFPLWLQPAWPANGRQPNVSSDAVGALANATGLRWTLGPDDGLPSGSPTSWDGRGDLETSFGPRDVLDFVYAVLHSRSYRTRYGDLLMSDFARVPLTPARSLMRALVGLGDQLITLHLMGSPGRDHVATYKGPENPDVRRASWSAATVWIDTAETRGDDLVHHRNSGFHGVSEDAWLFRVGGYQVCEKWLKDRKGQTLSADDISHYQMIVVAVTETIRLMADIDSVIEQSGGWPGAFQAD